MPWLPEEGEGAWQGAWQEYWSADLHLDEAGLQRQQSPALLLLLLLLLTPLPRPLTQGPTQPGDTARS